MAKAITRKQEIFVAEYCAHSDGTRAAIAAGYSEKSAKSQASQLLNNPKIAARISNKTQKIVNKLEISAERVLQELAKLAFLDPRSFFDSTGALIPITELDSSVAACLSGMEVEELFEGRGENRQHIGRVKKIKFADKGQNLERLGRHLKLFTDKFEAEVNDKRGSADERIAAILATAAKRAASAS